MYPELKDSMYPDLAEDGQPQDSITQLRAAVAKLKGARSGPAAQRERMVYELWTISELAADTACREEFLRLEGVRLVLAYLSEGNSLGCQTAVAQILRRTAAAEGVCDAVYETGSIAPLVQMLSRPETPKQGEISCRAAAAGALRELAGTGRKAQVEVMFQLCAWCTRQPEGQAAPPEPSFIAPLALMLQVPPTAESALAASLLARVTKDLPVQEYGQFSSCAGTSAVACLVAALQQGGAAATFARAALFALLYTPNQMAVLTELVHGLPNPDHLFLEIPEPAREAAGLFLWELATDNVNLAALLAQVAGLPAALELALRARSLAGVGLVQLLTCDHARPTNSVATPFNTDSMRLQLVAHEQVMPSLVQLLYSEDQVSVQAAAHALANLTAFRSAAARESRFSGLRRSSSSFANHPNSMVADSEACDRLVALLSCPSPAVVAPALALLNNLCVDNENRDKVREAAKRWGLDQFKQRLEQLCAWAMLSDKCRAAARTSLQRLLASKLERSPVQYNLLTLMMRPPGKA